MYVHVEDNSDRTGNGRGLSMPNRSLESRGRCEAEASFCLPPVLSQPQIFVHSSRSGSPVMLCYAMLCGGGLPTKEAWPSDNAEAVFSQRRKLELDFGWGRGGKE